VGGAPAGRGLGASWAAFLPLGELCARRAALQAPVVALFALYQGFLFYLFTHHWGPL